MIRDQVTGPRLPSFDLLNTRQLPAVWPPRYGITSRGSTSSIRDNYPRLDLLGMEQRPTLDPKGLALPPPSGPRADRSLVFGHRLPLWRVSANCSAIRATSGSVIGFRSSITGLLVIGYWLSTTPNRCSQFGGDLSLGVDIFRKYLILSIYWYYRGFIDNIRGMIIPGNKKSISNFLG